MPDYCYWYAVFQSLSSFERVGEAGDTIVNIFCYRNELAAVSKFQVFVVGEVEFQFQ